MLASTPITDEKARKLAVEEVGLFFEKNNLTPMEARVFALLLLSDPPELDFTAIQEFLDASKSTVSNSLKRLINDGRVDYMTRPGNRKRYFKVSPDKWLEQLKQRFAAVGPFADTMREINAMREQSDSHDFNKQLAHIQSFFDFLGVEKAAMMEKWEQQNK